MKTIKLMALLVLPLLMVACQTEKISKTQLKLDQFTLKTRDLSKRWKFVGGDRSTDYGGESYTVTYLIDDHNFLSHTISIYANSSQATDAYEKWNNEWFNVTSEWQPSNYSPLDQKDDYKFDCLKLSPESPLVGCRYLQRHNEIISFVRVGLDNTTLTFAELDGILGILDERLSTANLEETPIP